MRDQWQAAAAAVVVASCAWGVAGAEETTESGKPLASRKSQYKPPPGYWTRKRGDKVI